MTPASLLLAVLTFAAGEAPLPTEINILAECSSFLPPVEKGKFQPTILIRDVKELDRCLAQAAGQKGEDKNHEQLLKITAQAFQVKEINLEKQMIAVVGFARSPTPNTSLEIYRVSVSRDRVTTIHWRVIRPAGLDVCACGPPCSHAVLLDRANGKVEFKEGESRTRTPNDAREGIRFSPKTKE
jgi:hypothetical protein